MSRIPKNLSSGFTARIETNQDVETTEDGLRFEITDLGRGGIVLSMKLKKGADQLRYYCVADLGLCFHICKSRFSRCG